MQTGRRRLAGLGAWAAVVVAAASLGACTPGGRPAAGSAAAPAPDAPVGASAGASATSTPAPIALRVTYAATSGSTTPIWLAQDAGLFRAQGLDVELVYLAGTRSEQSVASGETPIGVAGSVIPFRLSGADLVAVAGVMNRITYTLFARPGIASPAELRGKTMVSTVPGATNTSGILVTLRHFGLEPHRDVALQPTGGTAEQLAIMAQGLADAALFSPPATLKARELGLVPLADITALDLPFSQTIVETSERYAREQPDVVRRFLRGYVAGVALARADAAAAQAALGKYSQTDDPLVLEETYRYYRDVWGRPDFRVQPEAVQSILQVLDLPGAATAQPADFVDNRFVDALHASGYVRESGALE
jgi:NitT/TauT family transport system substrate-binding protein